MPSGAVRGSENFYRQIIDAAADYAIIALDPAGHVTLWNHGAERLLGWKADEMAGQDLTRLFPDGDGLVAFAREMNAARIEERGSAEGWRQRKSGERFWASGEMRPVRNEAGLVTGYVKVLRDRTEEYEASQALRRSEERLRRAQEAGHVGVFTINIADNWLEPTPEFCRIFGIAEAEGMAPEAVERLIVPEDQAKPSDASKRASGAMEMDVEYRIRRPSDGAIRIVSRRAELERDSAGEPVRLLGVVQDVTEQRAVQRAAEESEARARANGERVQLALAAGAIIGTWVWDVHADRFTIDEQFATSFGIDPSLGREGLSLDQVIETVHPEDKAGLAAAIEEAIARGGPYAHQYRVRRTDGQYYW
ncbi:MAG: PAS domain S-box protein, partial [Sphingobium sp.]